MLGQGSRVLLILTQISIPCTRQIIFCQFTTRFHKIYLDVLPIYSPIQNWSKAGQK
jgi:hypothetical protein